jgi:hypothetical protein
MFLGVKISGSQDFWESRFLGVNVHISRSSGKNLQDRYGEVTLGLKIAKDTKLQFPSETLPISLSKRYPA